MNLSWKRAEHPDNAGFDDPGIRKAYKRRIDVLVDHISSTKRSAFPSHHRDPAVRVVNIAKFFKCREQPVKDPWVYRVCSETGRLYAHPQKREAHINREEFLNLGIQDWYLEEARAKDEKSKKEAVKLYLKCASLLPFHRVLIESITDILFLPFLRKHTNLMRIGCPHSPEEAEAIINQFLANHETAALDNDGNIVAIDQFHIGHEFESGPGTAVTFSPVVDKKRLKKTLCQATTPLYMEQCGFHIFFETGNCEFDVSPAKMHSLLDILTHFFSPPFIFQECEHYKAQQRLLYPPH